MYTSEPNIPVNSKSLRVLEIQKEAGEWNKTSKEEYTLRGWAWYRDNKATTLITGDNEGGTNHGCSAKQLIRDKKMEVSRTFIEILRPNSGDYEAIRKAYEGKKILGPRKKGGQRETLQIVFI